LLAGCTSSENNAPRSDSGLEISYAKLLDGNTLMLPSPNAPSSFRVAFELRNVGTKPWNVQLGSSAKGGTFLYLIDHENRVHPFRTTGEASQMTTAQPGGKLPVEIEIGSTKQELPEGTYRVVGAYEQSDDKQADVFTGKVMGTDGAFIHVVDNLEAKKNRQY